MLIWSDEPVPPPFLEVAEGKASSSVRSCGLESSLGGVSDSDVRDGAEKLAIVSPGAAEGAFLLLPSSEKLRREEVWEADCA